MPMNSYFAKTKNNFYGVWLPILIRSIKVLPNEWDFLIPNPIKIQRRVVDGNCERLIDRWLDEGMDRWHLIAEVSLSLAIISLDTNQQNWWTY